jgi:hypothetical protein
VANVAEIGDVMGGWPPPDREPATGKGRPIVVAQRP